MKLTTYLCDKCGKEHPEHALCAFYQGKFRKSLGTKHLCNKCNEKFIKEFNEYFEFFQNVLKSKP